MSTTIIDCLLTTPPPFFLIPCSPLQSLCYRAMCSCARAIRASSSLLAKGFGGQPKPHKLLKVFSQGNFLCPENGSRNLLLLNHNSPPGRDSRGWFHHKPFTEWQIYQIHLWVLCFLAAKEHRPNLNRHDVRPLFQTYIQSRYQRYFKGGNF